MSYNSVIDHVESLFFAHASHVKCTIKEDNQSADSWEKEKTSFSNIRKQMNKIMHYLLMNYVLCLHSGCIVVNENDFAGNELHLTSEHFASIKKKNQTCPRQKNYCHNRPMLCLMLLMCSALVSNLMNVLKLPRTRVFLQQTKKVSKFTQGKRWANVLEMSKVR